MRGSHALLSVAGLHGAMAIGLGAYAAHGMAPSFGPEAVEWTRTGALYQLIHAVALVAVMGLRGRLDAGAPAFAAAVAGWAFAVGPALFAGALYGLAFWGWRELAIAAPVGGGLLMLGWLALVVLGYTKGHK